MRDHLPYFSRWSRLDPHSFAPKSYACQEYVFYFVDNRIGSMPVVFLLFFHTIPYIVVWCTLV